MRRNRIFPLGTIENGVFRRITNTATMHKLVGGITDVAITFTGVIPFLVITRSFRSYNRAFIKI